MKQKNCPALLVALALVLLMSTVALAEAPGPVQNLRVAALGDPWVEIAWDAPANAADEALVYFVRVEGQEAQEADDSENRTHRLEGLTGHEEAIISVYAEGAQEDAAQVSVIPGLAAAPQLRLTAGDGTIQAAWSTPATMEGETVTRYEVDTGDGQWQDLGQRTSMYYGDLENDKPFTLTLRAYIDAQDAYSPEVSQTATPYKPAEPPEAVAIEPGIERIDITWEAPADDGGHAIVGYVFSLDSGITWPYATQDADTLSFALENLTDGELYGFAMAAQTEAGIGLPYEAWVIPPAPLAPQNLTATPGDGQVTLQWDPPASQGETSITTYDVCVDPTLWILVDDVQSFVFPGIENGTSYTFYVRARNSLGTGPYAIVNAMPIGAPQAPVRLSVSEVSGGMAVRWSAPEKDGGSPITGYEVSWGGTEWTDVGTSTQHTFAGVSAANSQTFYVRALNALGTSEEARVQYNPVVEQAPTAPTNLAAYPQDSSVRLTWNRPNSDGDSAVLYYEVAIEGQGWINVGLTNAFTAQYLTNGTNYIFYVRAVNAVGAGPDAQIDATPGLVAPRSGEPQNPRLLDFGDRYITIAWDPPADSDGSTTYEVALEYGGAWNNVGYQTELTLTELDNGMTYTVYIRGINAYGVPSAAVYVYGTPSAP